MGTSLVGWTGWRMERALGRGMQRVGHPFCPVPLHPPHPLSKREMPPTPPCRGMAITSIPATDGADLALLEAAGVSIHPCIHPCPSLLGEPQPAAAGPRQTPARAALRLPDWCGQDQPGHGHGHPGPPPPPRSCPEARVSGAAAGVGLGGCPFPPGLD